MGQADGRASTDLRASLSPGRSSTASTLAAPPATPCEKGVAVQALLDERREMLETLDALVQAREKFATKARNRVVDKPSAHYPVEEMIRKAQHKFDRGAEILRHRLLLGDSVLSTRGIRPWEDEES